MTDIQSNSQPAADADDAPANNVRGSVAAPKLVLPDTALTAGVAGSMTMMIANTVGALVVLPLAWVALGVSMLFAALVNTGSGPRWQRAIYFVLNSLIIFAVGFGTNNLGRGVAGDALQAAAQNTRLVSPANAEPANDASSDNALPESLKKILEQSDLSKEDKIKLVKELSTQLKTEKSDTRFFKAWDF